jgi:hypothetical protein
MLILLKLNTVLITVFRYKNLVNPQFETRFAKILVIFSRHDEV